jgi:hypothetical protein
VNEEDKAFEDSIQAAMKEGLLKLYAMQEPNQFLQVMGFTEADPEAFLKSVYAKEKPYMFADTDKDNDCFIFGQAKELMSGTWSVRVLIRDEEDLSVTVRLLRKIADKIEQRTDEWPDVIGGAL